MRRTMAAGRLCGVDLWRRGCPGRRHNAVSPGSSLLQEDTVDAPPLAATDGVIDRVSALVHGKTEDIKAVATDPEIEDALLQGARMLLTWVVPEGGWLQHAGAIVGFAFGQGANDKAGKPTPGATNRGLAWSVATLLRAYERHGRKRPKVMLQWEIAQVLAEEHGIQSDVVAHVGPDGEYLSTVGVMEHFAPTLFAEGVNAVALVAHPDHAVRCAKVVQQFKVTALGTPYLQRGVPWEQFAADRSGYDPKATQGWTTSRSRYISYELHIRGKMVHGKEIDF